MGIKVNIIFFLLYPFDLLEYLLTIVLFLIQGPGLGETDMSSLGSG
jgi:hypothetical protein